MRRPSLARTLFIMALVSAVEGCFALFDLEGYGPPKPHAEAGDVPNDAQAEGAQVDAEAGRPAPTKLVFVTSAQFGTDDDLGSADAFCEQAAAKAGYTKKFSAWISLNAGSPSTRFGALIDGGSDAAQLVMVNGQVVAADYAELVEAGPRTALVVTENGMALPESTGCVDLPSLVWTGTTGSGTRDPTAPTSNCYDWRTKNPSAMARVGRLVEHRTEWSSACSLPCNQRARLYCFEQ